MLLTPEANGGGALSLFLLLIFPWVAELVPNEQELDLLLWTQTPLESDHLVVRVAPRVVIHVNMKGKK
jgi:hypothetical protein